MGALTACDHRPSPNPREAGCVRCGRTLDRQPGERPRDEDRERTLTAMASETIEDGHRVATSLSNYADMRAHDGGVRLGRNLRVDALEELADARNYLVWDTEDHWPAYEAGDLEAGERVAENMAALSGVLRAWAALLR